MMMKILCGTDLLPKSDSALERAGMLAERLAAQCVLVHAVPGAEPHDRLEEELRHATSRLRQRVVSSRWRHRVEPALEVRRGSPVPVLVDTARELEPQLIVLGSNRRRFASDALAGTIAERVVRQVDCPVLVVRRMPWRTYSRVVLVLDRADSNEVAAAAGRLVLHDEASTPVARAHASFRASVTPAIEYSEMGRLNPDLLVVGVGRRGWVRRMVLEDAARRLLATRGSDVLLVPRRRQCMAPGRSADGGGSGRWSTLMRTLRPGRRARVYCRYA